MNLKSYYDENNNLRPLLLSELIEYAQQAFDEHGDMLVWLSQMEVGYEDNIDHESPGTHLVTIQDRTYAEGHGYGFSDSDFNKTFIIHGD